MNIMTSTVRTMWCVTLLTFSMVASAQTVHNVTVGNNFFSPANITIQAGDTVRWTNAADSGPIHNVTGDWGSSTTAESFIYEFTFNDPGVLNYLCTIHPGSMQGSVTVEGGGGGDADLSMSEVSVNNNIVYAPGDMLAIGAEVDNVGSAESAAYSVDFFVSADSNITTADALLGTANRSALNAGNSDNFSVSFNLPQSLAEGNYFIGAIIDIEDDNNANNSNFEDEPIQVTQSTGSDFVINNGLNDAWFNETTAGQGFFITVFPDVGAIFLAWFTYDTERPAEDVMALLGEPGHRWLTAFGNYEGNVASLNIELTTGGVFNSDEPMVVQDPNYGTIEIEFADCDNALLLYDIPSLGLMGVIPITRIALDNVPACLAAQPQ
ncbi:MAG TPA: plastocyanin/azurin family copper-binding protein [Xanthomonadales bacterium]|nr:plastocyanin/azurin family copper-binding protein [Xanthomonadales bacterium]